MTEGELCQHLIAMSGDNWGAESECREHAKKIRAEFLRLKRFDEIVEKIRAKLDEQILLGDTHTYRTAFNALGWSVGVRIAEFVIKLIPPTDSAPTARKEEGGAA